MPHFIIECSEDVLTMQKPNQTVDAIHETALETGLFDTLKNVKVRIQAYPRFHFTNAGTQDDFIHVFGHIMGGRTTEQKVQLSESIVRKLKSMFPKVPVISMNIYEFDPDTYTNANNLE